MFKDTITEGYYYNLLSTREIIFLLTMASATMRRYINFLTVNENVETKLAFFHTNDCTFVLSYTFPLMFLIFPKANQGSSQSGKGGGSPVL